MDLNDYWQENRRFVTTVGTGVVVFLIAKLVLGSMYEDEIQAKRSVFEEELLRNGVVAAESQGQRQRHPVSCAGVILCVQRDAQRVASAVYVRCRRRFRTRRGDHVLHPATPARCR